MHTIPAGVNTLSPYLAHLCRDDRKEWDDGGGTAFGNLKAILDEQTILALRLTAFIGNESTNLSDGCRSG